MKKVDIYTDGSCKCNPGPGGWGAVLVYGTVEKEICGGAADTTNNRMELTAVIEALSLLKEPCEVTLTSDSKYVVDSITKGWVYSWQMKGWKKSDGKKVNKTDFLLWGLSGDGSVIKREKLKERLSLPKALSTNGLLDAINVLYTYEEIEKIVGEI